MIVLKRPPESGFPLKLRVIGVGAGNVQKPFMPKPTQFLSGKVAALIVVAAYNIGRYFGYFPVYQNHRDVMVANLFERLSVVNRGKK